MNLSYNHLSNSSELDDIVQLADITADRMVESPHMRIYKTADVIEKYASDIIETLAEHEHFIIKDDQEPIGYMSCEHQIEKSLWLFGAYLKPEYRKQ
ncbi:MAG: GNAT family N-acetyltransferase [bacterium]